MSDATQKCPVCGAVLPGRARFCAECGATMRPQSTSPSVPQSAVLPWFIAGVCVLAIHATMIILAVRRPEPAPGNQSNMVAPGATSGATGQPPDISNMTPREAADRLYDRIARASEAGDSGQVSFFGPMALQAYDRVQPTDADVRLHVGMIQLALNNTAAATAQADSIQRQAGTHLFGPLLKARAAEAAGNTAAARAAWRTFTANYDAERRKNLPEYDQHATMLNDARTAAQRAGS